MTVAFIRSKRLEGLFEVPEPIHLKIALNYSAWQVKVKDLGGGEYYVDISGIKYAFNCKPKAK